MKVLVTGGTGLAGSHTVRELLDHGHEITALVRSEAKFGRVYPDAPKGLVAAVGDIGDRASIERAMEGADAVLHAAAVVSMNNDDPDALIEANVGGVKNVIGAALDAGIERIVDVSTLSALFRVTKEGDPPITADDDPVDSEHAYGRSKAIAERWIRERQAEGAPVWTTYPSAVLGPDDPGMTESNNAIRYLAKWAVPRTSTGMQVVDARDLAIAHRLLIENTPDAKRHLVSGVFLPWREIARILREVGAGGRSIPVPGSRMRASGSAFDFIRRNAPFVPMDNPFTRESMLYATQWTPVDNSRVLLDLGLSYRSALETLRDTTAWMKRAGHV